MRNKLHILPAGRFPASLGVHVRALSLHAEQAGPQLVVPGLPHHGGRLDGGGLGGVQLPGGDHEEGSECS